MTFVVVNTKDFVVSRPPPIGSLGFQMMPADERRNPRLVPKNGLVDPGVVTLVLNHGTRPLSADQLTVSLDFQIAVHQMPVRADCGVRALGQPDGAAGYICLSSRTASCCCDPCSLKCQCNCS